MKAFLLAAGSGTRLRPLTNILPKCLLPIRGIPLLEIWLENCRAAGISEVLINTHSHAEKMRDFLAARKNGPKIVLVEETELLGSAGTLRRNRAFVEEEEAFFVLYADVLTNMNLTAMLAFHRQKRMAATLGIYRVPDPARCGIVTFDDQDIIQDFVEKPINPQSNWAFSGVMIATSAVIDLIAERRPADIGFDLLPKLVGKMAAYRITEYLIDIGTPENYEEAQKEQSALSCQHSVGRPPRVR